MNTEVNDDGHLQYGDGLTTKPDLQTAYVGSSVAYIAFDTMVLADGRVVLHSRLSTDTEDEDFLYEIHAREDAVAALGSMVQDAAEYLMERMCDLDMNTSTEELMLRLEQTLKHGLH
jgi:hypothetical protein